MSVTKLTFATAFNPGADLWVLPALSEFKLGPRLDWYMNLQLSDSLYHKPRQISPSLNTIIEKCDLVQRVTEVSDHAPLMISSQSLVPSRWIVQIKDSSDKNQWTHNIHAVWKMLFSPSIRIFLPQNFSEIEFQKTWTACDTYDNYSIVVNS